MTPYRAALVDIERVYQARQIAAIPVADSHVSAWVADRLPNQNPCAAGHSLVVVNGWLKCARCGAVLGKA